MKRRNFLSGVLDLPSTLKDRFIAFCTPEYHVERCGAPIVGGPVQPARKPARKPVQPQPKPSQSMPNAARTQSFAPRSLTPPQREVVQLLAEGKSMKLAAGRTADCHTARNPLLYYSLPRGHEGPHQA
jgi:hypothetical protein